MKDVIGTLLVILIVFVLGALFAVLFVLPAQASDLRNPATVTAFRKAHKCPATATVAPTCSGWVVNHIRPLCLGGADSVDNMEWEEVAPSYKRDVLERELCRQKDQKRLQELKKIVPKGTVIG